MEMMDIMAISRIGEFPRDFFQYPANEARLFQRYKPHAAVANATTPTALMSTVLTRAPQGTRWRWLEVGCPVGGCQAELPSALHQSPRADFQPVMRSDQET
jgi:hypothetical protein